MSDYLMSIDTDAIKEAQKDFEKLSEMLRIIHDSSFIKVAVDVAGIGSIIVDIISLRVAMKESRNDIGTQLSNMADDFNKNKNDIKEILRTIVKSISGTLAKPLKEELEGIKKYLTGESSSLEEKAKSLGDNISKGVAEGIKSGLRNIKMKTEEVGEGAIKEFQTTFEINSPSKVMKRLGGYIAEGLGIGIKDGTKDVKSAMGDINDTVESSAKKTSKTKFSFGGIAAVATIVGTLVGYFVNLMSSNEELSGKMSEVWAKIQEALSPVIEVVSGLFDAFTTGGEGTTSMLDTIVEVIGGVAEFIAGVIETIVGFFQENSDTISGIVSVVWEFIQGIIEFAKEVFGGLFEVIGAFFAEHGDEIMAAVSTVWNFISGILEGAKEIIGGVLDIVVGIFTGNGEKIKEGFGKVWEGIKGIFSGVGEFFSGIWDKVVSLFSKVGTKIGDAIGGAFKAVINAIIGFAELMINGFLKGINLAIGIVNKIPGVEIKKINLLTIPKLADGGLVSAGQVFVAREAGPELVGTFGAKSAVMNNSQIVEAVSRGVYNAVSSAMGSGGSYTFNISNQLDGREIGKQVIKYHNGVVKQTGYSPLLI